MTEADRKRDVVFAVAVAILGPTALVAFVHFTGLRPSRPAGAILSEIPQVGAAAWLLSKWGWWRRVGWRAPVWRNLWLLWLPVLLLAGSLAASHDIPLHEPGRVATAVVAALLIGFAEETWYRGLLIEALLRWRALVATVASAAVFGVAHLVNARVIGFSSAAAQSLAAFGIGLMFGAARIRLRSLVPLVIIHAAFDVVFLTGLGRPELPSLTGMRLRSLGMLIAFALLYAVVLTRPSKTESVSEVVPTLG